MPRKELEETGRSRPWGGVFLLLEGPWWQDKGRAHPERRSASGSLESTALAPQQPQVSTCCALAPGSWLAHGAVAAALTLRAPSMP